MTATERKIFLEQISNCKDAIWNIKKESAEKEALEGLITRLDIMRCLLKAQDWE